MKSKATERQHWGILLPDQTVWQHGETWPTPESACADALYVHEDIADRSPLEESKFDPIRVAAAFGYVPIRVKIVEDKG